MKWRPYESTGRSVPVALRFFIRPRDSASDRILGFTVFGAEASELMATVQTAMLGRLPFTLLRDAIFTHATAAEGLTVLVADVATAARQPSER